MTSQEITTAETAIRITRYEALQEQIAIAQQKAPNAVFQYRDPKGNKAARSYCYELRQLRSAVEKARKEAKAYALEYGRRVDGMAKELAGQVTALIEPHETEIKRIEEEEAERVRAHEETIARLRAYQTAEYATAMDVEHALYDLDAITTGGLEEYREDGEKIKAESRERLEQLHANLAKAEAERAELERLRAAEQERQAKEREEQIRREAAEQARREAEQEAKRKEAEARTQREREKAERERKEAEAERQRKAEAEEAQREREAAEQARQAAEAEAERLREAEAERQKREAEAEEKRQREEAEAKAKAEAEEKARAARRQDLIDALVDLIRQSRLEPEVAAAAIIDDQVPNLRIRVEFADSAK